jgi:VanZ family protein
MAKSQAKNLWWILVVLWMSLIFLMSSQTSSDSATMSGKLIRGIARWMIPGFTGYSPDMQRTIVADLQNLTRKMAHMFLYTVLGGLCMAAMLQYGMRMRFRVIVAAATGVVYAVTDEVHQLFVNPAFPPTHNDRSPVRP